MAIACFLWRWGLLYPTSICVMEAHRDDLGLVLGCGKLIICFSVIFLWKSVRASEILFYFNF